LDGSDVATPSVPPDPDDDWLDAIAAVGTGDDDSDTPNDILFAQLGDESDLLHLLGPARRKSKR
jgi:hypothetical protein